MKVYGYVRVSASDQNEEKQLIAMNEKQILPENIYCNSVLANVVMRSMGVHNYFLLISLFILIIILKHSFIAIISAIPMFNIICMSEIGS